MWNGKKIFISKQAGIGDVVIATPIFAAIKKRYPTCKLSLMTFSNAVEIMQGLPFIDEVFAYDKQRDSALSLIKKLWHYDVALLLDMQYRPALLSALARIPVRIGITHKRKFWLTHGVAWEEYMDHTYEPYVFADILHKTIGLTIPQAELQQLYIAPPAAADILSVKKLLRKNNLSDTDRYIVCSPVTAYFLKDWGLANWNKLFTMIYDNYQIRTIIFGGGKLAFAWHKDAVIDLSGQTNLRQAAYLIERAALLVNSCSLPIHLANAVHTETIALYGFGDPNRWAPKRHCEVINANLPCSPCDGYKGTTCTQPKCMAAISVEAVYKVCERKLGETFAKD